MAEKEALKTQMAIDKQAADNRVKIHKDNADRQRSALDQERQHLEAQKKVNPLSVFTCPLHRKSEEYLSLGWESCALGRSLKCSPHAFSKSSF